MTHFSFGPITEIITDKQDVHAFHIASHIDDDASEALAKHMNAVFDSSDKVSMLLDLTAFTGGEWDTMLDTDVISSRFRALKSVKRYAVVGAPERAARMITYMDKVMPFDAKAFDTEEIAQAWDFVGASPAATAA
jgi:hypothetical protein